MSDFAMIDAEEAKIRVASMGEGPLVLFVHGFPESWYSWRNQMEAVANAGYRACAMDVRGYGGSDRPQAVTAYAMQHLVADVAGVAAVLQPDAPAILVGHDWGAPIVWHTALTRPDRIGAVAAMSVAYLGIPRRPFSETYRSKFSNQNKFFYQEWLEQPGVAEAEAEADIRRFLLKMYGGSPVDAPRGASFMDAMTDPAAIPAWLDEAHLSYYIAQFEVAGFNGPMNRYRNYEADFAWTEDFRGTKILQPALFIAGDRDPATDVFGLVPNFAEVMKTQVPNLEAVHILEGGGHWIQQERPEEVSALLVDWLRRLTVPTSSDLLP